MKVNYLCNSWQFMLQQLVYMIGRGYYYYHVGIIPTSKGDKANKIDSKIIQKYDIDLSKYQRARRKKKKLANFYYLRWQNIFVILHTDGQLEVPNDDYFYDIRLKQCEANRLKIRVSDLLEFNLALQHKDSDKRSVTVAFSNTTFKEFKAQLEEFVQYRQVKQVNEFFKNLRNLPAWQGVIKQEYKLLEEVYKMAKKYNLNTKKINTIKYPKEYPSLDLYPLRINTYRKIYDSKYTNTI